MELNLRDLSLQEEMLPFSPKIWSLLPLFPNDKHPTGLHPASEHGSLRTIDDDSTLRNCRIPLNEQEELELAIRAVEQDHERWMFDYECSKSNTSMNTSNDGIEGQMMEPQVTQLEDPQVLGIVKKNKGKREKNINKMVKKTRLRAWKPASSAKTVRKTNPSEEYFVQETRSQEIILLPVFAPQTTIISLLGCN